MNLDLQSHTRTHGSTETNFDFLRALFRPDNNVAIAMVSNYQPRWMRQYAQDHYPLILTGGKL